MSVRQYVGARYVPVFADPIEWNNTRNYEPLTIVTYYGSSYTSKKFVPAGTDINNSEFWALTGNLNGSINSLTTKVEEIENDVNNLKSTFDKYIISVWDSYGTGMPSHGNPYIDPVIPERISSYIPTNYTHLYSAEGGASFCNGRFLYQFNNIVSNMSADEKLKVTDVYVMGGYNDISTNPGVTEQNFADAADAFYNRAKEVCPNAIIHVAFLAWDNRGYVQALSTTRGWYMQLTKRHYDVVVNAQWFMHNPDFYIVYSDQSTNHVHPNNSCAEALARFFAQYFQTYNADAVFSFTLTKDDLEAYDDNEINKEAYNPRIFVDVYNERAIIKILCLYNSLPIRLANGPVTYFTGNSINLLKMKEDRRIRGYQAMAIIPATYDLYTSNNNYISCQGYVSFADGNISFVASAKENNFSIDYAGSNRTSLSVIGVLLNDTIGVINTLYL